MDRRDVELAHVLLTRPLIYIVLKGHYVVFGELIQTQIISIYNVNPASDIFVFSITE